MSEGEKEIGENSDDINIDIGENESKKSNRNNIFNETLIYNGKIIL